MAVNIAQFSTLCDQISNALSFPTADSARSTFLDILTAPAADGGGGVPRSVIGDNRCQQVKPALLYLLHHAAGGHSSLSIVWTALQCINAHAIRENLARLVASSSERHCFGPPPPALAHCVPAGVSFACPTPLPKPAAAGHPINIMDLAPADCAWLGAQLGGCDIVQLATQMALPTHAAALGWPPNGAMLVTQLKQRAVALDALCDALSACHFSGVALQVQRRFHAASKHLSVQDRKVETFRRNDDNGDDQNDDQQNAAGNALLRFPSNHAPLATRQQSWRTFFQQRGASTLGGSAAYAEQFLTQHARKLYNWTATKRVCALLGVHQQPERWADLLDQRPFVAPYLLCLADALHIEHEWRDTLEHDREAAFDVLLAHVALPALTGHVDVDTLCHTLKLPANVRLLRRLIAALPHGIVKRRRTLAARPDLLIAAYDDNRRLSFLKIYAKHAAGVSFDQAQDHHAERAGCFYASAPALWDAIEEEVLQRTHAVVVPSIVSRASSTDWIAAFVDALDLDEHDSTLVADFLRQSKLRAEQLSSLDRAMLAEAGLALGPQLQVLHHAKSFAPV